MKICWCTIHVSNLEESKKFYGEILGLKLAKSFNPHPGVTIVFFEGDDGAEIELIADGNENAPDAAGNISIGFAVPNLESMVQKMQENQIEILRGPLTLGKDTYCFFVKDPNDIEIQIVEEK